MHDTATHDTRPHHDVGSVTRVAAQATLHCLTGCAIGEVAGMVLGSWLAWSNLLTIAVSIALAFMFGYLLTLWPLRRAGLPWPRAIALALASDTVSIAIMEIVDNVVMLAIPGAMDSHLASPLFWGSLALSLGLAFLAAWPVNRWLIARGRGHAVVHSMHDHSGGHSSHAHH